MESLKEVITKISREFKNNLEVRNFQSSIQITIFLMLFSGYCNNLLAKMDNSLNEYLSVTPNAFEEFFMNKIASEKMRDLIEKINLSVDVEIAEDSINERAESADKTGQSEDKTNKQKIEAIVEGLKKEQQVRKIVQSLKDEQKSKNIFFHSEENSMEESDYITALSNEEHSFIISRINQGITDYNKNAEEYIEIPKKGFCLVMEKSRHELNVLKDGEIHTPTYQAISGSMEGDKEEVGDFKTPEGIFYLSHINYASSATISIGIGYPSKIDAERGFEDGLISKSEYRRIINDLNNKRMPYAGSALGGNNFIHGNRLKLSGKWREFGIEDFDWTWGCIAMENEDVYEIVRLLKSQINSSNKPYIIILP